MNSELVSARKPGLRTNVGIMVVNGRKQVLAGEAFHYPGEWLMPQGGVGPGEALLDAMKRELLEESGLDACKMDMIRELDEWITYNFRKPQLKDGVMYKGQQQKWFLLGHNGQAPEVKACVNQEFSRFAWVDPAWLVKNTTPMLGRVYRQVLRAFEPDFPG